MAKGRIFETATDTYTEKSEEGAGGSGTVFLVEDTDGHEFALKLLRDSSSGKRKRFANELNFCMAKHHENIVHVIDHGLFDTGKTKLPFYVMPYYPETLRSQMKQLRPEAAIQIFGQILSGVEAAHLRGVVHRDVKPENILLDSKRHLLVVADFGIAHFEEEDLLTAIETQDQERLANFVYAAPEQKIRGNGVDHRADIFALGLILNEMFTGTPPLAGGHPLIRAASPAHSYLDDVVNRMIRHSPEDRYPSIDELKRDLIARGNTFVVLQKLNEAKRAVVPASTSNDPLAGVPVTIKAREYEPGELIFRLEPHPPPKWLECLHRHFTEPTIYNGYMTYQLDVRQDGRIGLAPASEGTVASQAATFKAAVDLVNKEYQAKLRLEAQDLDQRTMAGLARRLKVAEEVERANRRLQELP